MSTESSNTLVQEKDRRNFCINLSNPMNRSNYSGQGVPRTPTCPLHGKMTNGDKSSKVIFNRITIMAGGPNEISH